VQLGAEMTVFERGVNAAVDPQRVGDRNAGKSDQVRAPVRARAFKREQAFARRH